MTTTTNHYSLQELNKMDTIMEGHSEDLKYDKKHIRIWLSRMTIEDGMTYNNEVSVEVRVNDQWSIVDTYEAK